MRNTSDQRPILAINRSPILLLMINVTYRICLIATKRCLNINF